MKTAGVTMFDVGWMLSDVKD